MDWIATIDWGDVLAALALLASIYASSRAHVLAKRQDGLVKDQARLNALLVAKEEKKAASAARADVSANLIKVGNDYRVRVFNKGPAVARNVDVRITGEGAHVLQEGMIRSKFPLDALEPSQSVDLHAIVYLGMGAVKFPIVLTWGDEVSDCNSKDVTLVL
jgi:hypothetical protein